LQNANVLIRNRKAIAVATRKHARLRATMWQWIEIAEAAEWKSLVDARATFPTADPIKGTAFTCFNVGGNNFRLIAIVSYERQEIVIDAVLTHAEYSKGF
jgi:mRNA interferase HigB